ESQANEPKQRPFALSMQPWRLIVSEADLPEPNPVINPLHEAGLLRHRTHSVDDRDVQQPKIAGVRRQSDITRHMKRPVVESTCRALERPNVGALPPHHVDDLIPLTPFAHHFGDRLRRMLQIAVHDDDSGAIGMIEPSGNRTFLSEIAAEVYHRDTRLAL